VSRLAFVARGGGSALQGAVHNGSQPNLFYGGRTVAKKKAAKKAAKKGAKKSSKKK
jgi:hypothetical protein